MKRRTLLLSTGALALVSMLPRPVAALAPVHPEYDLPIRTLGVIEQALDAVVNYGLTPLQRAKIFGFISSTNFDDETVDQLRTRLTDSIVLYEDTSAWNRARRIVAIDNTLRVQFPGNLHKQREAANTPISILASRSIREILSIGSGNLLARAAIVLGAPVANHDLDEMLAFD